MPKSSTGARTLERRPSTRALDGYAAALVAWRNGDVVRTLRLLEDETKPGSKGERTASAFLRARAYLALGRPTDATSVLKSVERDVSDTDDRLTLTVLRGTAAVRSGNTTEGLRMLQNAVGDSRNASGPVRSEASYELASALLAEQRYDDAENVLELSLENAPDAEQARAVALLGWIEVGRERFPIAARHFSEALAILARSGDRDEGLHASLLTALGSLSLETLDMGLARKVRRDVAATSWPPSLELPHAQVLRHLGCIALLEGNTAEAWRLFSQSAALLAGSPGAPGAQADLAAVLRISGDRFGPARHLEAAREALEMKGDAGDEDIHRISLLAVAVEAARAAIGYGKGNPEYRELAAGALERYAAVRVAPGPPSLARGRRVDALYAYAQGLVAITQGDGTGAITSLRRAWQIWGELGCRLREAESALELYRLTGEERYLDDAESATRTIPSSYLRREVESERHGADHKVRCLTPAERRVMLAICEGKTSKQIASEFNRSENTIRNQTKRVFSTMQVNTRSALVAECARIGLLADREK